MLLLHQSAQCQSCSSWKRFQGQGSDFPVHLSLLPSSSLPSSMFFSVSEMSKTQAFQNLIAKCLLCSHLLSSLLSPLPSQAPGIHDPYQDGQLPPGE